MSLIAEALQKADAPTPIHRRTPQTPRWITLALIGACAVVLWNLSNELSGKSGAAKQPVLQTWTPQATKSLVPAPAPAPVPKIFHELIGLPKTRDNLGLSLLRSANSQWRLSGVIQGDGEPLALINGSVVEQGSSVEGANVVRITENEVDIETDDGPLTLKLK